MTVLAAVLIVVGVLTVGVYVAQPRREHDDLSDDGLTELEARERLYPDGNVVVLQLERGAEASSPPQARSPLDTPAVDERSL